MCRRPRIAVEPAHLHHRLNIGDVEEQPPLRTRSTSTHPLAPQWPTRYRCKWRPQRFDDVVGQQAVTRTLRNAIGQRDAHGAGLRVRRVRAACGKTTTARILARALILRQGADAPTRAASATPCVEIAQGRDIDVMEIDAATHTGVDNIREGDHRRADASRPVRNRYKVFIIDEVHQLSTLLVQRAAEVDRGAAAARRLHDGHDRARQDS